MGIEKVLIFNDNFYKKGSIIDLEFTDNIGNLDVVSGVLKHLDESEIIIELQRGRSKKQLAVAVKSIKSIVKRRIVNRFIGVNAYVDEVLIHEGNFYSSNDLLEIEIRKFLKKKTIKGIIRNLHKNTITIETLSNTVGETLKIKTGTIKYIRLHTRHTRKYV